MSIGFTRPVRGGLAMALLLLLLGGVGVLSLAPGGFPALPIVRYFQGHVRVTPLRVVPPDAGECVGRVEVTVENGTSEPVHLGRLHVLQDGAVSDRWDTPNPQLGPEGPAFATFDSGAPGRDLEPGASCVLVKTVLRSREARARPVTMRAEVLVFTGETRQPTLATDPVEVDSGAWPVPLPVTADALDRALAGGHGLRVLLFSNAMPGGGKFWLDVGPDYDARAAGDGRRAGRPGSASGFRCGAVLTPGKAAALLAAIRGAPFTAFRHDPRHRTWEDGHVVRLLLAAGPAAVAARTPIDAIPRAALPPPGPHQPRQVRDLPA